MLSEDKFVIKTNNIELIIWIMLHQVLQKLGFTLGKLVIKLSIPGYLDSNHLILLGVIFALNDLCKTALTEDLYYLVSVEELVTDSYLIVPIVIIIDGFLCFKFIQSFDRCWQMWLSFL